MNEDVPHNEKAERSVIGSALVYGDRAVMAADALRGDEFFFPAHREAWQAICAQNACGVAIEPIGVGERIKQAGTGGMFDGGWQAWAIACTGDACIHHDVPGFAKIIRHHAASRRLIGLCTEAICTARGGAAWDDQIASLRNGVAQLENLTGGGETVHVSDAIRQAIDEVQAQQDGKSTPRVYSGVSTVDAIMDGAELGDLVVVAARPGVGKSAFVGNVAAHLGMHGVPSLFFSAEMMLKRLGRRWLSGDTKIDSNLLKRGQVDLEQWRKLTTSAGRFEKAFLWANESATRLDQIVAESRKWYARHVAPRYAQSGKPDDRRAAIVVDYAQRVRVGRPKGDTREQEVAKIPTELKELAKKLPVVVFLVAMLSRATEQRGGDPVLSDLRESGAFEQEADVVLFLSRHDGDRIIVAKNREGSTGAAQCIWVPEITTWRAPFDHEEPPPRTERRGCNCDEDVPASPTVEGRQRRDLE